MDLYNISCLICYVAMSYKHPRKQIVQSYQFSLNQLKIVKIDAVFMSNKILIYMIL